MTVEISLEFYRESLYRPQWQRLSRAWHRVGCRLNPQYIYKLALESAEKGLNSYGEEEGGEWIALENTGRGRRSIGDPL